MLGLTVDKKMNQSRILFVLVIVALVGGLNAQEWIPKGAKVCCRSQYEDGFLPDATFCLKLKVTKVQFEAIVKKLGATPHTEKRKYTDDKNWLQWGSEQGADDPFAKREAKGKVPPKDETHWDPSPDLSGTFVLQHKDSWKFLKYQDGFLYYKELNH